MTAPRVAIFDPGLRSRDDLGILLSDAGAQVLEAASLDGPKFSGQAVRGQADLVLVCVAEPDAPAAQDGIELLMRELGQERSGRGRFHRKVQLSQLCVSTGHENIALPILQELSAEIERRKLADWESPDLVARPLALLYQCLGKSGGDDELRTKLYSWICRLDPLMALNVSR